MTDDHNFTASGGGVPMIFRDARRSQHKVTCAGCDCEPGTTCDTKKRCGNCDLSKTYCDSLQDRNDLVRCCHACSH